MKLETDHRSRWDPSKQLDLKTCCKTSHPEKRENRRADFNRSIFIRLFRSGDDPFVRITGSNVVGISDNGMGTPREGGGGFLQRGETFSFAKDNSVLRCESKQVRLRCGFVDRCSRRDLLG